MNISCTIQIDEDILQVLVDYTTGVLIDSEYFLFKDGLEENIHKLGLMEGGFYCHYPLYPSQKGYLVLEAFKSQHINVLL